MPTDDVRARREKVVLDHFHDEVEQDIWQVAGANVRLKRWRREISTAAVL